MPGQRHPLDKAPLFLASVHPSGQWGLGQATWCFVDWEKAWRSARKALPCRGEAEGGTGRRHSSGKPSPGWSSSCRFAVSPPSEALLCPTSSAVTVREPRASWPCPSVPTPLGLRLGHGPWGAQAPEGPVRQAPHFWPDGRFQDTRSTVQTTRCGLPGTAGQAKCPDTSVTQRRPHHVAQEGRVATARAPPSSPRPRWGTRHTALGPSGTWSHKQTPRRRRPCSPGPHGAGSELRLT